MDHLDKLRSWQRRAQAAADDASHNGTKQAVEETTMTDAEREAAGQLFSALEDTIFRVCEHSYRKAIESEGEKPAVELEDVLQETYVLFLRSLVRYDPEKSDLQTYLLHALRRRVEVYLRSRSERRQEDDRPPVRNSERFQGHSTQDGKGPEIDILSGFDVIEIVNELVEEGHLDGGELWDEIRGYSA